MSENQNRSCRDFSEYDIMSTEDLEQILRLDAEAPVDEASDEELLFYVMGVLADRRNKSEFAGKTAQEAYESFKQHYLPYEEDIESVPKTGRKVISWLRPLTAAAAALIIVVGLSFSANAFCWDFWSVVAKWAKETFSFVGDGTDVSEPDTTIALEFTSLQDALEYYTRDSSIVPTWIPDGYELASVRIESNPLQKVFVAIYHKEENTIKITVRSYLSTEPEQIEQSADLIEIYPVDGIDYYIFSNNTRNLSAWIVDSYECCISGELTIDEIKAMIDSIGKG